MLKMVKEQSKNYTKPLISKVDIIYLLRIFLKLPILQMGDFIMTRLAVAGATGLVGTKC